MEVRVSIGHHQLVNSVQIRTEWWFCLDPWPISDKSTWADFHRAAAVAIDSIYMAVTPLSWANQIICLSCMINAPGKGHSSPPSICARVFFSKRKVGWWGKPVLKLSEWRNLCTFFRQFNNSVLHMFQKHGIYVAGFYSLFSKDVEFFKNLKYRPSFCWAEVSLI